MKADLINLVLFTERAQALIPQHVTEIGGVSRYDLRRNAQTSYMAPETLAELATAPTRWILDVEIKTHREMDCSGECNGVAEPTKAAHAAAQALADEYGLYYKFEPCEKGWGSFMFETKAVAS